MVAILEKLHGPHHRSLVDPLSDLVLVAVASGRPIVAIPLAERTLALQERVGTPPADGAEIRYKLAVALWDAPAGAGRDRKRALEQARSARDSLRGVKGSEQELAEIEQWLTRHRR
jgi:hypothetical protein